MEILAWAFLGGLAGAALMDITETYAAKAGISSGVNIALVGRWFLGLLRGQLTHADILHSKPCPHETKAGWAFHFLVGGGGVALIYPLFFQMMGLPLPNNHLLGGLLFGLQHHCCPSVMLHAKRHFQSLPKSGITRRGAQAMAIPLSSAATRLGRFWEGSLRASAWAAICGVADAWNRMTIPAHPRLAYGSPGAC